MLQERGQRTYFDKGTYPPFRILMSNLKNSWGFLGCTTFNWRSGICKILGSLLVNCPPQQAILVSTPLEPIQRQERGQPFHEYSAPLSQMCAKCDPFLVRASLLKQLKQSHSLGSRKFTMSLTGVGTPGSVTISSVPLSKKEEAGISR